MSLSCTHEITLDFASNRYENITVKQLDRLTRIVKASVTIDGNEYTIPSDATAQINIKKPDGRLTNGNATIQDNKLIYTLTNQDLAAAGNAMADFQIMSGNEILKTVSFTISILPTQYADESTISKDNFAAWEEFINETKASAQAAATSASNAATSASQAVSSASSASTSASNAHTSEVNAASSASAAHASEVQAAQYASDTQEAAQIVTDNEDAIIAIGENITAIQNAASNAQTATTKAAEASASAIAASASEARFTGASLAGFFAFLGTSGLG